MHKQHQKLMHKQHFPTEQFCPISHSIEKKTICTLLLITNQGYIFPFNYY